MIQISESKSSKEFRGPSFHRKLKEEEGSIKDAEEISNAS